MFSLEPSWRNLLINLDSTISHAIEVLNKTGLKIVIVVDEKEILIGTITDGDIRKGLLRGISLNESVDKIVHRDALVVPQAMNLEMVLQLMIANKVQQIPIVDINNQVSGIHLWDEINRVSTRSNFMIIMAGGMGTRLRPETETIPKPMLVAGGKPILHHIIEKAKADGFRHFIIAIYYLGNVIEDYFKDGSEFGVEIEYLRESEPLGTAGALSLLERKPMEDFVITNGDVITEINYGQLIDYHQIHDAIGTMAVRLHEFQNPFGAVQTDGIQISHYEEKPITYSLINAGVYVLRPDALNMLSRGVACDMPSLFEKLRSMEMKTIVYPIHEHWMDIGRKVDLQKAHSIKQINVIGEKHG